MFKHILFFILGTLLLMAYASAQAMGRGVPLGGATVEIGSVEIDPLATVSLPVTASLGNATMSAASIELHFDASVIQVESCTVPSTFFGSCNPDNEEGMLSFNALSVSGVTGNLTLADITFVAGQSGSTTLDIQIESFADMSGNPIEVSDVDGQITITSTTTPTFTATATQAPNTPTATATATATVTQAPNTPTATATETEVASTPTASPAGTRVEIESVEVAPSSSVALPVRASVEADTLMSAASIRVSFDPNVVQVEACEVPSSLFGSCAFDNTQGSISFNALSTTGVTGNFTLADITFVAGQSGNTTLDVEIQTFADMSGNPIEVSEVDGQISVTSTNNPTATATSTPTATATATQAPNTPTATATETEVASTPTASPAGTRVEIGSVEVAPSSSVALPVRASVEADTLMSAASIRVTFDPNVVQVETCEVPSSLFGTCAFDNTQGSISFNALSTTGVTGNFTLADLTFVAGQSGRTTLDVQIQTFADISGGPIEVSDVDGQISVTSTNGPTATPTSIPTSTPTAIPTSTASPAGTTVEIASVEVAPLNNTTVPVRASVQADTLMSAASIRVRFDSNVVQVKACEVPSSLFGSCAFDNTQGRISFNALSTAGVTGNLTLANITFVAGQSGSSTLDVQIQTFADMSGNPIEVSDVDGEIIVTSSDQAFQIFLPALQR